MSFLFIVSSFIHFFLKNYLLHCVCNDACFLFLPINWEHVLVYFEILLKINFKCLSLLHSVDQNTHENNSKEGRLLWEHGSRGFSSWLQWVQAMVSGVLCRVAWPHVHGVLAVWVYGGSCWLHDMKQRTISGFGITFKGTQ